MSAKILLGILLVFIIGCKKENGSDSRKAPIPDQTEINKLKINQLQILASHNSYHERIDKRLYAFLQNINFALPAKYKVEGLDYANEPLSDQLDVYRLRGFEIDIYNDPNGGLFYNRNGNRFAHMTVESNIPALKQPGLKVLHIPDIDYETLFYTFKSNLQALKDWSDAHPNHLPVFINIESKEETVADAVPLLNVVGFVQSVKFTPALADNIDTEIKSVFGNDLKDIFTPDQLRGSYSTLKEATLSDNWPTVGEARGKFFFIMEGPAVDDYLNGHPVLQNRAMFVYPNNPEAPEAAFVEYNEPLKLKDSILYAVQKNYIVRTRCDEINQENKTGDYTRMNMAFSSGAQILSSDYYRPDPRYLTQPNQFKDYTCKFPNGDLARINLISAPDKQGIGKIAE